jgi:hypothetical protein
MEDLGTWGIGGKEKKGGLFSNAVVWEGMCFSAWFLGVGGRSVLSVESKAVGGCFCASLEILGMHSRLKHDLQHFWQN